MTNDLLILTQFWEKHAQARFPVPAPPSTLSGPWIRREAKLPWLELLLPLEIDFDRILQEVKSIDHLFVPHRDKGGHLGWSSLCIHGLKSTYTQGYEHYGYELGKEPIDKYGWTDICPQIPYTHQLFRDLFPYQAYRRIRFMRLAPGGYILPHNDTDQRGLGPVNIAINQPAECSMVQEEHGVIPFCDKSSFHIDISLNHAVWNRSNEVRYHIIVHGDPAPEWNDVLIQSFKVARTKELKLPPPSNRTYTPSSWKSYQFLGSDIKSFSYYLAPEKINTRDFKVQIDTHEGDSTLCESEIEKVRYLFEEFCDPKELGVISIKEVCANSVSELKTEWDAWHFIFGSSEAVPIEYEKHIRYDLKDTEDDLLLCRFSAEEGQLFSLNPSGHSTIENKSDQSFFLVSLRPPFSVIKKFSCAEILKSKAPHSSSDLITTHCVAMAINGFRRNERLLRNWREAGIPSSALPPNIKIICIRQPHSQLEQNALIENLLKPSLSPIQIDRVDLDEIDTHLENMPESVDSVCIFSPGASVKGLPIFLYELIRLSFKLSQQGLPLCGHIMDWGDDRMPYMHEQFTLINLKIWRALGRPSLLKPSDKESKDFPPYRASEKKFHDHYTPHKLTPSSDGGRRGSWGWCTRYMAESLKNQYSIINVPQTLRETKTYNYPSFKP